MTKISIRFYNDREVRAVWDEEKSKWWFSVLDIVGVLNDQDDYQKNRNYWKYLKTKLKGENSEVVSGTNQLKLLAPDGKHRLTDVLDYDGVLLLAKGGFQFAMAQFLPQTLSTIEHMPETTFEEIADKYVEMNIAHPFREGNGRATRIWLDLILKKQLQKCVDWSKIDKNDYLNAMQKSVADSSDIKRLLQFALTDKINDRETFMKGIDYSYYYEQEE